jgi:beta-lactamase class A
MFQTALLVLLTATPSGPDVLRGALQQRISQVKGATVAVAYQDLGDSKDAVFLEADRSLHAASTMKVPVMLEFFRQVDAGKLSLDQPLTLVNQFHSIVDGSPYSLDAKEDEDAALYERIGKPVPARELLQRMITRSSNLATNSVIALVDAKRVTETLRTLGAKQMTVLRGVEDGKAYQKGLNNTATARDLATVLAAIEQGKAASASSTQAMRAILLAQELNDEIPAGLPPGTPVAHKTGQITGVLHDAAIVYPPGRAPYILVVLTSGVPDQKVARSIIVDISRSVYAHATRNARKP